MIIVESISSLFAVELIHQFSHGFQIVIISNYVTSHVAKLLAKAYLLRVIIFDLNSVELSSIGLDEHKSGKYAKSSAEHFSLVIILIIIFIFNSA